MNNGARILDTTIREVRTPPSKIGTLAASSNPRRLLHHPHLLPRPSLPLKQLSLPPAPKRTLLQAGELAGVRGLLTASVEEAPILGAGITAGLPLQLVLVRPIQGRKDPVLTRSVALGL